MTVGEIIYNRRKELGLTLEEIGNATGVSKSTVKKWENGFIANMRRDRIEKLAKILQISPITLLGIDDDYIETHEFLKTLDDPEYTSHQVKEQDKYVDKLIEKRKYENLVSALRPYVRDPKEQAVAISIATQFPRLNMNGLMKLLERLEELIRFDEYARKVRQDRKEDV